MADKEEAPGQETPARGNEWEVVSLTASAYAAAPGPEGVGLNGDNTEKSNDVDGEAAGTSNAMIMSRHFVFPPSQHENLPLDFEPNSGHTSEEHGYKDVDPEPDIEEAVKFDRKAEEDGDIKGLTSADDFPGVQIFDEKVNRIPIHGTEFYEETSLQGLNLDDKEQMVISTSKFGSFHNEAIIGGSIECEKKTVLQEVIEPSERGIDSQDSQSPKTKKDDTYDGSKQCEAWWKRRAACFYAHAKEVNSLWSICLAAAVMGLVILGHRWQQERWRVLQLKWQIGVGDANTSKMVGPLSRVKDVIVGGHQPGSSIGASCSTDR